VGGSAPNPFFMIPFTTPFTYIGGDLVVTFSHTGNDTDIYAVTDGRIVDSLGNTVLENVFNATTGVTGYFNYQIVQLEYSSGAEVPEPATMLLLGSGLLGLVGYGRKKFKK
jgi:acetate kinase